MADDPKEFVRIYHPDQKDSEALVTREAYEEVHKELGFRLVRKTTESTTEKAAPAAGKK